MGSRSRFIAIPLMAVALLGVLGLRAWWWFATGAEIPLTEAEAQHYLDRMVAAAREGDFDDLCRLNGAVANCQRDLQVACPEEPNHGKGLPPEQLHQLCQKAVPPEAPQVIASRHASKEVPDGTAGRVLVVAGIDGWGRQYRTDVMVFRENRSHFKAINAVYWSNERMGASRPPYSARAEPAR